MRLNPFKPTAGKTPPAIIGRESVIEEFVEGIQNGAGAPGRLMRIGGVRGTGKTVLLKEIRDLACGFGWGVIDEVATEGFCARILERLSPDQRIKSATLEPSILGVSLGGIRLERVGPSLREALSSAIRKNGCGLLITLDEVQDVGLDEMRVLATTVQQVIGDDLDIAFVFAGLPSMIESVINGKTLTFLRRAVPFELSTVSVREVAYSLHDTFEASGISLADELAVRLAKASRGYPFLIQLVGYHTWQYAQRADVDEVDEKSVDRGIAMARERFDHMVIEPALQRVAPMELRYLLAMAEDGGSASSVSSIADRLGKTLQQLSIYRSRLIRESLIEVPVRGKVGFAIPYMADYLQAHHDEFLADLE